MTPGTDGAPEGEGTPGPAAPRPSLYRRAVRRIPPRMRAHWKLPAALVAFIAVAALVFGGLRVSPMITGDETVVSSEITNNVEGAVDLFDDSVHHEVSVEIPDAEYTRMVDDFVDNGEKRWVNATVTIDGTVLNNVGVRLKGNSTLQSLRGGRGFPGGGEPPEGFPGGGQGGGAAAGGTADGAGQGQGADGAGQGADGAAAPAADDATAPAAGTGDATGQAADQAGAPGGMAGGPGGMMGGMTQLSADDPTSLPLLLSFDKYEDGRGYEGVTSLSVRPGSPVVNEAMALSLTAATGQVSQRYAYAVYSVNGGATASRLLLEVPDDGYVTRITSDDGPLAGRRGYLYKADANSRFTYVGDDQSDYSEQFVQVNSVDSGNLQPIIDLLKWVDGADDEEFADHLGDHVDLDSFAQYIATQNLLSNMDDMSGPGQNYYLWYDLDSEKFTIISWDLNLAMQGDTSAGPHDAISMGGGRGMPGGQGMPAMPEGQDGQNLPAMPEGQGGRTMPGGADGGGMPGGADGGGMPGGMRTQNPLKQRFLDASSGDGAFAELYESTYWDLFDRIYGGGEAEKVLDGLAGSIPASDGLSDDDRASAIADMRTWIDDRTTALAPQRGA